MEEKIIEVPEEKQERISGIEILENDVEKQKYIKSLPLVSCSKCGRTRITLLKADKNDPKKGYICKPCLMQYVRSLTQRKSK